MYTVGTVGILKWVKRLKLSTTAGIYLLLMYSFNGAIVSKMGIGYVHICSSMYLAPWIFLIIFDLIQIDKNNYNLLIVKSIECSFIFFLVLLQGSFHIFFHFFCIGFLLLMFYPNKLIYYFGSF